MSYTINNDIEAQHYNLFVYGAATGTPPNLSSTTAKFLWRYWGPGYGQYGVNQLDSDLPGLPTQPAGSIGSITEVRGASAGDSAQDDITSVQWTGLFSAINRLRYHQSGGAGNVSLTSTTIPNVGNSIKIVTGIQAAIDDCHTNTGKSYATTTLPIGTHNGFALSRASEATNYTATMTRTITWPSGDDARWFFNAGGKVQINLQTASISGLRSDSIGRCIRALGTFVVKYDDTEYTGSQNDPGANNTALNKGYWELGSTYRQVAKYTEGSGSGSSYVGTYAVLRVKLDSVTPGVNGDNGDQLTFELTVYSTYGGTGSESAWLTTDGIALTALMNISVFNPGNTTYNTLTKRWTDPTVTADGPN